MLILILKTKKNTKGSFLSKEKKMRTLIKN